MPNGARAYRRERSQRRVTRILRPSISAVNPAGLAIFAFASGLLLGLLLAWLAMRPRLAGAAPERQPEPPAVPAGVADVLRVLKSSALVVGPHDEVLQATESARSYGLVRGTRIAIPEVLDLVRAVRRSGTIRQLDIELKRGSRAASAFFGGRVAPLGHDLIVVLAEDQTAARRIEQTRRDFVANVSHELKTPVGAIALLAEAVEDAAEDPPAVRRFAGRMGIEAARLADLVAQIIDLSRLQSEDPLASPEVVEIDEVLADAVDRCRVDAEQHGVSLTVAGTQGCRVLGSARQLSTAVSNLVENAVVYSERGTRVVVAAHVQIMSDDDYVEVTVSDNGIGISAREQERIFERFYRVDYARSRATGGTGLGLAIVKHIAATHGGSVSVWSQPGQGSTFTIRIPAHLSGAAAPVDDGSAAVVALQPARRPDRQEIGR